MFTTSHTFQVVYSSSSLSLIKSYDKRTCLQLHEYKHNTNMIQLKSKEIYLKKNQTMNEQ